MNFASTFFIGFNYCYGTKENCAFKILNYANTTDYEIIDDFLLKLDTVNPLDLKTNSYVIAPTIGYPSINVPIGFDGDSLPYGMEILSKQDNESLIYSLALV